MTNLVFGVGIGLFLILILWAIALLIFVISLRVEKKIGIIAILIVGVCTLILIALPKTSEKANTTGKKIYDHLFVWRIILLVLLSISSVIGLLGYFKFTLTEPIRPVRISNWVF